MENSAMNGQGADGMHGREDGMMAMKSRRMWHWTCCLLPIVTLLMWLASVFFVVVSWLSVTAEEGAVWGYGPQWWIWNAVMFGILAIYGSRSKMGCHCGYCMHGKGAGMCSCKPGCACASGKCTC